MFVSVRGTGNKVTDILLAGQRRHGPTIGFPCAARGQDAMLSPLQLRPKYRLPDPTTTRDGGIGQSGIGKIGGIQYGGKRFLSLDGHYPFAPSEQIYLLIVKQQAEIICTKVMERTIDPALN
jgi:hypothetical protein